MKEIGILLTVLIAVGTAVKEILDDE